MSKPNLHGKGNGKDGKGTPAPDYTPANENGTRNGTRVNGHRVNGSSLTIAKEDIGELAATALNIFQGREAGTALHLCYTDPKEEGGQDSGAKDYDDWVLHEDNYNFHDEVALIEQHADRIVARLPDDAVFVEIGPGGVDNGHDSPVRRKTLALVEAFERVKGFKPQGYHAIDTNERYAREATEYIAQEAGVENRGFTVSDYRDKRMTANFGEGTPVLIVLGGTLMNLPVRQDTSPTDAFKRNIQYIYDLIADKQGFFFMTHDETDEEQDIKKAYDPQDPEHKDLVKKLGKTFLHRIFNELATEGFSPDDFDMEIGWREVEGTNAMTVTAVANKDKDFTINGIHLSVKQGQEFDLAYSFKVAGFDVQNIVHAVGFNNIKPYKEQQGGRVNSILSRAVPRFSAK